MRLFIIATIVLSSTQLLFSQATTIAFGSTFENSDGLFWANESGTRFDTGNDGVLAVGYFTELVGNSTLSDYLADFNSLGSSSFVGNQSVPGYLTASASTGLNLTAETPYVVLLTGISDFSSASSATGYAVISDTGWSFEAPASPTPSLTNLQTTISPNSITVGSLVSVGDGFQINATAVPEPSTFALLGGIAALGLVMWRRRR